MSEEEQNDWHLDKKVPLSLIFTILLQTIAVVWFGAKMDSRVETLERSDLRHEKDIEKFSQYHEESRDRMSRIETGVARIESKLDQVRK